MPRRNAAVSLVALAALGLATGCEKQSPWVTVTAGGVVVKARATKYCRGTEDPKCNTSAEKPVIKVKDGDLIGIDVPRSVANDGWRVVELGGNTFWDDHYRTIPISGLPPGDLPLTVERDPAKGEGRWTFTVRVEQ